MYVAVPIHFNGSIVGAVSIGKAVASQHELVQTARQKLLYVGLITLIAFFLLLVVFSIWITRPFGLTTDLLRVMRQEGFRHPWRMARRMGAVMKAAFDDMRDVLAGHSHTEEYVQTLTHELKSPLTAIRGAAELLREPMPDAQRERFVSNIGEQVKRLQNLADRLLELASLEARRTLEEIRPVDVPALIAEAMNAMEPAANLKKIDLRTGAIEPVRLEGDHFLLCQAMMNFLSNAIDFSPPASEIEVAVKVDGRYVEMTVRDHGPGVPDFAAGRVFEKFYSLRRPDSGRKSTGLGLAFVREIAHLHGGEAYITNHPQGGAMAVLRLPSVPA
jgi:two-component system sensor histidine kinase CreC